MNAMNVMTYKGYSARVEYSEEDGGLFVGHLAGINDIVGFHGDSVKDLRAAFEESVADYIETCAKGGKEPQKPYSGKMMFGLHRRRIAAPLLRLSWLERASTNGAKTCWRKQHRATRFGMHSANWTANRHAGLQAKSLARRGGFEPPTPRFVVWGLALPLVSAPFLE